MQTFRMPDVGEGLTEAEIVRWFVEPGEQVDVNQIVCEIETAKALVELPCPSRDRGPATRHDRGDRAGGRGPDQRRDR